MQKANTCYAADFVALPHSIAINFSSSKTPLMRGECEKRPRAEPECTKTYMRIRARGRQSNRPQKWVYERCYC